MWYSKREMKKTILSLGVLLSFALFVLSFPFINFVSAESSVETSSLSAQLIEQIGEETHSLFSNMSNAQVTDQTFEYYNGGVKYTTKSVIERVLTDAMSNINSASGSGSYVLSEDLKTLSEVLNLYVSANLGMLSLSGSERDIVDFTLSVGDKEKTVTSSVVYQSGTYRPGFVETEKILIDGQTQIDFGFSTRVGYGQDSSEGFLIFDPTLNFSAELDSVTVLTDGRNVFSGEKIQLSAQNALSSLTGGSLIKSLKEYFSIEWEVVDGNATVDGNILTINASSGSVLVRAKCKKATDSEEYVYSQPIEFNVSKPTGVGVVSNFENSFSNISLSGQVLRLTLSNGFALDRVLTESGEEIAFSVSGQNVTIQNVNQNLKPNLSLVLKKTLEIEKVEIANKVYDSTTNATIIEVITNAEAGHKVEITGLVATFEAANAGSDVNVLISGTPVLSGEDSDLYVLSSQLTDENGALVEGIVSAAAEIYQRQITVIAQETSKEFGAADPEIQYQIKGILPQDSLSGSLSREYSQDERIGEYRITIGTLGNDNYQIFLISNIFEIEKRTIEVIDIIVEDREYDQTTQITSGEASFSTEEDRTIYKNGNLTIVFSSADVLEDFSRIEIVAQAQFLSASAAVNKEVDLEFYLTGADRNNYDLISNITPTGNILPRKIDVYGENKTKQFGFEDPQLTYNTSGLLPGDTLSGNVQRQNGESVGNYVIGVGTLSNPNYEINFIAANFAITPRQIQIEIQSKIKQYLDSDPKLTWTITSGSEVDGYPLNVVLTRTQGETIGDYPIEIASYNQECYLITVAAPANLTIIKRDVTVQIGILDREFDSTTVAQISSKFTNLPTTNPDNIRVNSGLSAKFQDENIGVWPITYYFGGEVVSSFNQEVIEGSNLVCYNFQFQFQESAEIVKRKITIYYLFVLSKEYGDLDGAFNVFSYSNSYEGMEEDLKFKVEREPGEEVGQYELYFIEPYEGANNNFDITLAEDYKYHIIPRQILIETEAASKVFGEEDPEIIYWLSDETPLPPKEVLLFEELVLGTPSREPGENAGVYAHTLGNMMIEQSRRHRYKLVISSGGLRIMPRPIEIKIDDQTKEYGDPTPTFTYEILAGSLVSPSDLKISTDSTDNAGTWSLYAEINTSNYDVACNVAVYTITPAPLTVGPLNGSKIYGEEDPELRVEILFGSLKKGETLSQILSGSLEREEGEDVGFYAISQGTLSSNGNYELTYTGSATFEIIKRDVTVTADEIKLFLDQLPFTGELTYKISPALIGGDVLEGELEVEEITGLGSFKISQGTLNNDNYNIIFEESYVTVSKRLIVIQADSHQKTYDSSPFSQPTFQILPESQLIDGQGAQYFGIVASVSQSSNVGSYPITIEYGIVDDQLDEQRKQEIERYYDVQIITGTLNITPAKITITVNDYVLTYGETLPTSNDLTYSITSGTNYNNEIVVNLNWKNNNNAGQYDISASFSGAENYEITCNYGKVIINKKPIKVNIDDIQKTYGTQDPTLSYQIEGLLEGDQLFGSIKREEGEDAGRYEITFSYNNSNYIVSANQAYFTIEPRPLYVTIYASDKVYDGTDQVKTSFEISNLLENDLVVLTLNANFVDAQIGDNKEVLFTHSLSGDDGHNYVVEVVNEPTANITKKTISNGGVTITVSDDNTILTEDVSLVVERIAIDNFSTIEGRETLFEYRIVLMKAGQVLENVGNLTVGIRLLEEDPESFDLFLQSAETEIDFRLRTRRLTFETESLGNFLAVKPLPSNTLMYVLIGLGSAAALAGIVTGAVLIAKRKSSNKKSKPKI